MKKLWIICLLVISTPLSLAAELTQSSANKAVQANLLAQEGKLDAAIEILTSAKPSKAYDKAYFAYMTGVFYWQNDQLKPAITALTEAVNSQELGELTGSTRRMLADLLLSDHQFKQALPHYYTLLKELPDEQKEDELWLRVAQIHYQIQEWKPTLAAIARYEAFKHPDALTPLSVKLGAQLQLEQWKASLPTLKRLIALEPTKGNWWLQLASIELRLGQHKEALSTLSLAQLQGVELSEQELKLLAQLHAQNGAPERAVRILEQLPVAADDVQLLMEKATYWQQAKEWDQAIDTWRLAAQIEQKYHWNLAQLLSQQKRYKEALIALDQVKETNKQSQVALARARALYQLNQLDDALAQAKKADNLKPSAEAKGWIKYLTQLSVAKTQQVS